MRMYLWDQQDYTRAMASWPIFHGPLTSDLGQIIKIKIIVQDRLLSSANGSKLIFHMGPAGIYKSHDLLTYISRSADFRLGPIFHG